MITAEESFIYVLPNVTLQFRFARSGQNVNCKRWFCDFQDAHFRASFLPEWVQSLR